MGRPVSQLILAHDKPGQRMKCQSCSHVTQQRRNFHEISADAVEHAEKVHFVLDHSFQEDGLHETFRYYHVPTGAQVHSVRLNGDRHFTLDSVKPGVTTLCGQVVRVLELPPPPVALVQTYPFATHTYRPWGIHRTCDECAKLLTAE
jgi:hypothetical protein